MSATALPQIDVGNKLGKADDVNEVSGQDRLQFAKQLLFWLGFICICVFGGYAFAPENKALAAIFELVKIGALPIVTLVISFYFPSRNAK